MTKQADSLSVVVSRTLFKAYDIRGDSTILLTPVVMQRIGYAFGRHLMAQGDPQVIIGRDGRLSSPVLCQATIEGLVASGCHVVDIGLVPTPLVNFACDYLGVKNSVMVTASHNPINDNGLKLTVARLPFCGEALMALFDRVHDTPKNHHLSGRYQTASIHDAYIAFVQQAINRRLPYKVVVDCGHGAASTVTPQVLTALGCQVIPLYCTVDGHFPAHHPNPSEPDNMLALQKSVIQHQADIGFAFDGDGDRLGVVDHAGNIVWPDRVLMVLARALLKRHPHRTVLWDIKSSNLLPDVIRSAGGYPLMCRSGYAPLRQKMIQTGALLAGEMSGHILFSDSPSGIDDATYTACRLLQHYAQQNAKTISWHNVPQQVSTPEIIVTLPHGIAQQWLRQFVDMAQFEGAKLCTIDGLRVDFTDGWGIVRCSNTTPSLVFRFEATEQHALRRIQQAFKRYIVQILPAISVPF